MGLEADPILTLATATEAWYRYAFVPPRSCCATKH